MSAQQSNKRPAPDAATAHALQTLPPAQRPQQQQQQQQQIPMPHSVQNGVSGSTPIDLTQDHREADDRERALANAVLHRRLLQQPPEVWLAMLMAFAQLDSNLRSRIEGYVSRLESAEAEKQRKAEERRLKAEERKMRTPLNFDKLIERVENYMEKETPWNWSRSRELSEGHRVSAGIEKIFTQILARCSAESPTAIKVQSLTAVVTMLSIVVKAPPSFTKRNCINDTFLWRDFFWRLWERLSAEEKHYIATKPDFVELLVTVDLEWREYSIPEMLGKVAAAMHASAGDALSEIYGRRGSSSPDGTTPESME